MDLLDSMSGDGDMDMDMSGDMNTADAPHLCLPPILWNVFQDRPLAIQGQCSAVCLYVFHRVSCPAVFCYPNKMQECCFMMDAELLLTAKDVNTVNQWASGWARCTRDRGTHSRLKRYDDFMRQTAELFLSSDNVYRFDIVPVLLFDCHGLVISVTEWDHVKKSMVALQSARPQSPHSPPASADPTASALDSHRSGQSGLMNRPVKRPAAVPEVGVRVTRRSVSSSASAVSTASTDTDASGRSGAGVSNGDRDRELRRQLEALKLENKALKFLLDTKDQKISQQKKIIKQCQTKTLRASKQLQRLKNTVTAGLQRECRGKNFEVTRVQTCKTAQKKLNQLRYGKLEAYLESQEGVDVDDDDAALTGGWLTPQGTIALALRRNMSNCSAQDLGMVLLQDTSRSTVLRSECKVGAALIADSRLFFERWQQELCHGPHLSEGKPSVSLTFLHYREDATNHRHKMMALELHAAYVVSSQDADALAAISMEHLSSMKRLADVVPVSDGSGLGTMRMSEKMLSSLGCPTWHDFLRLHERHVQAEHSQLVPRSMSTVGLV